MKGADAVECDDGDGVGGRRDPQFRDRFPFPPIEPDRLVEDGERVTLGDATLVAAEPPAP